MMTITNIKHRFQPTGNTCGPACIYMAGDFIYRAQNDLPWDKEFPHSIEEIEVMCGTDWIVGTPPERMEKGFKALGLNYVEFIKSSRPFTLLQETIRSNHVAIVRTITRGVPHWIIVNEYYQDENAYGVLDPWQGIIQYTEEELNSIWCQRDYQYFEILTKK